MSLNNSIPKNIPTLYVLEEQFYPECWKNDQRMGVLLSEFRVKTLNPENYDSKMKFWKEMIINYCEYKGSCNVSISELKTAFKRKGTSPYCLPIVFEDMLNSKEIIAKEQFLQTPDQSWSGWAVNTLIKKPIFWGIKKVQDRIMPSNDETVEYIVQDVIKNQSRNLHQHFEKEADKVLTKDYVKNKVSEIGLSSIGVDLATHHLWQQKKVFISQIDSNTAKEQYFLKFADLNGEAKEISEVERSMLNLEKSEASLNAIIVELGLKIDDTMKLVRECIREGKKPMAKTHLRTKHMLEKNLEKYSSTLENIQSIKFNIDQAQNDKNVINAYKSGSHALKQVLDDSGLTLDKVDEAIDDMKDIMNAHNEIQEVIGSTQISVADDLELEEELNELLDITNLVEKNKTNSIDDEIEKRLMKLRMDLPDLENISPVESQSALRN